MVSLVQVTEKERELLFNLQQKYLYEMTNYYDNPIDEKGNITYGYFEEYFHDPRRFAYLLYAEDELCGFVMINPYSYFKDPDVNVMAEFTVFPQYRCRHIGSEAVYRILSKHPGKWEIKFHHDNHAAANFWRKNTLAYFPEERAFGKDETVLLFHVR